MTSQIIESYVEEHTALILRALGLSRLPDANSDRRRAAEGVCRELVMIAIRRDFFGLDAGAMGALNVQWDQARRKLDDLKEDDEPRFGFSVVGGDES